MASKQITSARATTPVACGKDENKVFEAAFSGERSRPVCAINEKGELIVCCRTTAKKHGWAVEGKLYQRVRGSKAEAPAATDKPAADKPAKAARAKSVKELLA